MLERLGVDGMSSDETTEDEDGTKQSRVLVKDWRSLELTHWLRQFDTIPENEGSRGRQPRFRFYSNKTQCNTKPKKGLPCNAYNTSWKDGLPAYEKAELSIDVREYEFSTTS